MPATRRVFRGTPQASYVHVGAATAWADVPWRAQHGRHRLIGSASNLVHRYSAGQARFTTPLTQLRLALHASCAAANDSRVCAHLPLSPTASYKKLHELRMVREIGAFYVNTTFCPMPIGDACTRKAIIDALLLGCLPVLVHPCQRLQWPWHWGCLLYTSPSPRDRQKSRMPSSA